MMFSWQEMIIYEHNVHCACNCTSNLYFYLRFLVLQIKPIILYMLSVLCTTVLCTEEYKSHT